jgi:acetate kinase
VSAPGAVLAVNAGSSSLKFALYPHADGAVQAARLSGCFEALQPGGAPSLRLQTAQGETRQALAGTGDGYARALARLDGLVGELGGGVRIDAIAHRIVHGGPRLAASVALDPATLDYLDSLAPLAPLHQPHNLEGVRAFQRSHPHLPQIGCFDTAFHATLPEIETTFGLPRDVRALGVRRYGFHGLSYRYVNARLAERSSRAGGRLLVAHLGNGASACAIAGGASVATTMGLSALDGLMMGTRSGALDPGVLLHLLRAGWSAAELESMLYQRSGLLGLSGVSADMRTLHASAAPDARLAVAVFGHRLLRECGALVACLGGLDVLAFTGGIGEHDAVLRQRTCDALSYMGVRLDEGANRAAVGARIMPIHAAGSAVEVWVVPTDEGRVAAGDAVRLLSNQE